MSAKNILAVAAFLLVAASSAYLTDYFIAADSGGNTQNSAEQRTTDRLSNSTDQPLSSQTVVEKSREGRPTSEREILINGAKYSSGPGVGSNATQQNPGPSGDANAESARVPEPVEAVEPPGSRAELEQSRPRVEEATQDIVTVSPPLPERHPIPSHETGTLRSGADVEADPQETRRVDAGFSPNGCAPGAETSSYKGKEFSLTEKIGQMLVVGFRGASANEEWPQELAAQIRDGWVGGVLFLGHNVKSAGGVKGLLRSFKAAGGRLPPLLMVDQEGGLVQRLGPEVGWKKLQAAESVARTRTPEEAYALYRRTARVLWQWGFNTNLAPVVDVNVYKRNPIIGRLGRAYSDRPSEVVQYAQAFIQAHRDENVLTSIKHFPGHGSSRQDSHEGFTDISRTWEPSVEIAPFHDLIRRSCVDMIMSGHLFLDRYQVAQAGNLPATLSARVLESLLRDEIGYDGVIVTDDMEMGAIRKHFGQREAVLKAIKAGNDLIMVSNTARPDPQLPRVLVRFIATEAQKDPNLMERINKSFQRIMRLKSRLAVGQ
jgi:beta-N-acetylhexosaminidase